MNIYVHLLKKYLIFPCFNAINLYFGSCFLNYITLHQLSHRLMNSQTREALSSQVLAGRLVENKSSTFSSLFRLSPPGPNIKPVKLYPGNSLTWGSIYYENVLNYAAGNACRVKNNCRTYRNWNSVLFQQGFIIRRDLEICT